jgi:uncharacterized protein YndB with AHSA1/START domain
MAGPRIEFEEDSGMNHGTVQQTRAGQVLRFERHYEHPVERVWQALTTPERLVEWLAAAHVEPRRGGRIELRWQNTDGQGDSPVLHGEITEYDPPRLIEYHGDIHGVLRWELAEADGGCDLRFTSTLAEPLDPEMTDTVLAGWHSHLDFLADALDGRPVDWPNWPVDRWKEHYESYSARRHRRS